MSEDECNNRNQHILKLNGLPLYCFSRDLAELGAKLKAKCVYVSHMNGTCFPSTTAYLYFENEDDKSDAILL